METKEKTYYGKIEGWEAYEIPIMIKCYNICLQGNVLSCRTLVTPNETHNSRTNYALLLWWLDKYDDL